MNIPEGWPTPEMTLAGVQVFLCNSIESWPPSHSVCERIFKAMHSAAPTPPEVEPVAEIHVVDGTVSVHGRKLVRLPHGTKLYASPPSPKAEWDAEGNPLNLMAAARVAYFAIKVEHGYEHPACVHLRKFLKDES